jgi:2,3-bisphosphoglycerate-dependent phosphoglycerate mutase
VTERPPRLDEVTDDFARVTAATRRTADVLEAARVAESLDDVVGRVRRWYGEVLLPSLHQGESAVVVAHGNSLRALVAVIDHLADAETERLNVPTGEPLRYPVGPSGDPLPRTGTYLDPASAQAAIHAVEREGGT